MCAITAKRTIIVDATGMVATAVERQMLTIIHNVMNVCVNNLKGV